MKNRTTQTLAPPRRPDRLGARWKRLASTIAVIAVALVGTVVGVAAPASAASYGAGYGTQDNNIGWMGAYAIPGTGTLVYCIDPGVATPTGSTTSAGITSNITSHSNSGVSVTLSPDTLARINAAVTTWGQTGDNRTASAVHFVVQYLGNPEGMFGSGGYGNQDSNLRNFINWKLVSTIGTAEVNAVADLAQSMLDQVAGITAGDGSTSTTGSLVFATDAMNDYAGTVTPTFSGTVQSGTITLTNGIFTSTGTATITGAQADTAYDIVGVPPTDPDGYPVPDYKIGGSGVFSVSGSGWVGALELWTTAGQQQTVAPGGRSSTEIAVTGEDPSSRSTVFEPIVTTEAPAFVAEGESFTDSLTASVASGAWIKNSAGVPAPVVTKGTLYGPFNSRPDEADSAPASAPIAATAEVTLNGEGAYTATAGTSDEAGYYVWQWHIDAGDQIAGVQRRIPDGYAWRDRFAQTIETSVTPNGFSAVSKVSASEVAIGDAVSDTLTIGLPDNGAWIRGDDGSRIPVTFTGTAFFVEGDTAPEFSETAPEGAEAIGTTTITVDEPGTYTSDELTAPLAQGWVTWVWRIDTDAQPEQYQGYVKQWSDGFGLPDETTRVLAPVVTTNAQPGAKLGGELFDVATVTGRIPASPTTLDFAAYKVPVVRDASGEWVIDAPEGSTPGDLSWVCDAEPVFTTEESIVVTEAGEYTSESFVPTEYSKYLWVETLSVTPEGGEPVVVHTGLCGVAEESSVIVDVTTKAQTTDGDQTVDTGEQAWDRAVLNGYVPEGATVTITGYQTSSSTPMTEACTADTQVFTWTSEPLPRGMAENLEIDSAKFTPEKLGTDSKVYFIETTKDALGRTVSTGECGEPDETLSVEGAGTIAWTGGDSTPALWVGGIALIALFGAAAAYMIRRCQPA